jgi:hypothetical protein
MYLLLGVLLGVFAKRVEVKQTVQTKQVYHDRTTELLQASVYAKQDIFGSELPRIEFDRED